MPFSGPASSFAIVARIEAAYLQMINSKGGVNGRKIELIQLDDAYSPPAPSNRPASLSTATRCWRSQERSERRRTWRLRSISTRAGVPQILAMSGSAALDNPKLYPWTTPFYAPQVVEGRIAARYILDTKPDAKLAILYPE